MFKKSIKYLFYSFLLTYISVVILTFISPSFNSWYLKTFTLRHTVFIKISDDKRYKVETIQTTKPFENWFEGVIPRTYGGGIPASYTYTFIRLYDNKTGKLLDESQICVLGEDRFSAFTDKSFYQSGQRYIEGEDLFGFSGRCEVYIK